MIISYLEMFKNLQISKKELCNNIGKKLHDITIDNPVIVNTTDVINVLDAYKIGKISINQMLEWVNIVWFTDLFEYDERQCDSIASVLNVLEELDEKDKNLTEDDIDKYITVLLNNDEI